MIFGEVVSVIIINNNYTISSGLFEGHRIYVSHNPGLKHLCKEVNVPEMCYLLPAALSGLLLGGEPQSLFPVWRSWGRWQLWYLLTSLSWLLPYQSVLDYFLDSYLPAVLHALILSKRSGMSKNYGVAKLPKYQWNHCALFDFRFNFPMNCVITNKHLT